MNKIYLCVDNIVTQSLNIRYYLYILQIFLYFSQGSLILTSNAKSLQGLL